MSLQDTDLPEGWRLVATADIANVVGGGTPKTSEAGNFTSETGHPWITPADLTGFKDKFISRGKRNLTDQGLRTSSAKYMPAGSVLFSSRAPIGYVAIAANPLTTSQGFRSLIPSDEIDSEYLYYAMKSLRAEAEQVASGTTFAEISGSTIKKLRFPLAPLETQRRIVKLLDVATTRCDSAGKRVAHARQAIERFRQSVLSAAVSGILTAGWTDAAGTGTGVDLLKQIRMVRREILGSRYKTPEVIQEPWEVPDAWAWGSPLELSDPIRIITYGVIKLGGTVPGGVPTLRSSDVRWLRIEADRVKRIDKQIADKYQRTYVRGGDVLVTVRGTLGGVAVVPPEMSGWNISREVALIPPASDMFGPYLAIAIASPQCQRWLRAVAKGVAYTGINIEDLRLLPIPVPSLSEQIEIANRVQSCLKVSDVILERMSEAMVILVRTSQSVLSRAIAGELVA